LGDWQKIAASIERALENKNEIIYTNEDNMNFEKITASLGVDVNKENYEALTLELITKKNELEAELASTKDRLNKIELSMKPKEVSKETIKFALKSYKAELNNLVTKGTIQPAKASQIEKLYMGDQMAVMLSNEKENELDRLLTVLNGIEPVSLENKTNIAIDPENELKIKEVNPFLEQMKSANMQKMIAEMNSQIKKNI
jgi:hypothetical protein